MYLNKSCLVPAPLDYEADNQDENIVPNIQIYLDLIALILVAFFLFLAVFLNLANISTVAGKNKSIIGLLLKNQCWLPNQRNLRGLSPNGAD